MRTATNDRRVTAILDQRMCRVQFKAGGKVVATSPVYRSRNIMTKIVAYARRTVKPESGSIAVFQVHNGTGFVKAKS